MTLEEVTTLKEAIKRLKEVIKEVRSTIQPFLYDNEAKDYILKALEQEPCDDCISRQAVIELCEGWWLGHTKEDDFATEIRALPSVNQQKPKEGYISIDDVMSVFDDFMCGEVDEDGTEIFLEMLKDKAESEE